jgi:hypothetical protein
MGRNLGYNKTGSEVADMFTISGSSYFEKL